MPQLSDLQRASRQSTMVQRVKPVEGREVLVVDARANQSGRSVVDERLGRLVAESQRRSDDAGSR